MLRVAGILSDMSTPCGAPTPDGPCPVIPDFVRPNGRCHKHAAVGRGPTGVAAVNVSVPSAEQFPCFNAECAERFHSEPVCPGIQPDPMLFEMLKHIAENPRPPSDEPVVVLGPEDYPDRSLPEVDLVERRFRNHDFGSADFNELDFDGAEMFDVKFSDASLVRSLWTGVRGARVDFGGAHMGDCVMRDVALPRSVFDASTNMSGLNVEDSDLSGSVFDGAVLHEANFNGCAIRFASFRDANLENSWFDDSDLSGSDFCGARIPQGFSPRSIENADFRGATIDDRPVRPEDFHVLSGWETAAFS